MIIFDSQPVELLAAPSGYFYNNLLLLNFV
jgi:hypothetical protein